MRRNRRPVFRPARGPWSASQLSRDREGLAFALAVSLYLHGMLLLLRFGAPGIGWPSLALPWTERRVEAPPMTVRLVEAPRAPPVAPAPEPVAQQRVPPPTVTAKRPKPVTPPRADPSFEVHLPRAEPAPLSVPRRVARAQAPAAKARARDRKIPAQPQKQILAQSAPQEETFKVPPPKLAEPEHRAPETTAKKQAEEPPPAVQAAEQAEETARLQAEEAARQRAEEDARQRALALLKELEAKKQEEARRLAEAKKQEEARRQALELEARRRAEETARQEAEELARQRAAALQKEQEAKKQEEARRIEETRKQEEAKVQEELKKQEEASRLALQTEALRRAEEAARQAAARKKELEAKRQAEEAAARAKEIAERQQAEAQAAAQRERDRLAAQPPPGPGPAPGALSGKDLAAKALEQLRTPGAARDEVLRPPSPPARAENPRRRSLFGVERDVALRMYVDSWRVKLERNGAMNYRLSAGWRARDNPPIVTVAIRSDGSLEDVWIHRSSGVREIDEAVRRIAQLYAPYSAFPPDLARQYDVIEIRRIWSFDNTLRIMDEM